MRSACTDSNRYAIVRMDSAGRTLATIPEGAVWERDSTDCIGVDGSGNLYAPRLYEGLVYVTDSHGKPVNHFGGAGDGLGFFHRGGAPGPVRVDTRGRLLVCNGMDIDVLDREGHGVARLARAWTKGLRDSTWGPTGSSGWSTATRSCGWTVGD